MKLKLTETTVETPMHEVTVLVDGKPETFVIPDYSALLLHGNASASVKAHEAYMAKRRSKMN